MQSAAWAVQVTTAGAAASSAGSRVINLIGSCSLHIFQLLTPNSVLLQQLSPCRGSESVKPQICAQMLRLGSLLILTCCLTSAVLAVRDTKFYDVLGIAPDASEAVIKKAYRKQAMKWHPDRNPDNVEKANRRFREVTWGREVAAETTACCTAMAATCGPRPMSHAGLCTYMQHLLNVMIDCLQIAAAYEVLSDDKKKSVYDQVRAGCSSQSTDACTCPILQLP